MKILVVDDDREIADLVEIHLKSEGYDVRKAYGSRMGLDIFNKENDISLAILDIMMPGIDGLTMCAMIREKSNIPIIMLSAKTSDNDKIKGLSTGADDYMVKPFNPLELSARVASQLRRYTKLNPVSQTEDGSQAKENNYIEAGPLTMNRETFEVTSYGKEVKLTGTEFEILFLLASHPGKVFSTDEIFENVWGEEMYEANNTVMVHIRRIRGKIEADPKEPRLITTSWGVGYKFEG